jgi:uncharacterized lipoprotein YbaY
MKRQLLLALMFLAAAIIAACSDQEQSTAGSESCEASVTGTIAFPDPADLPDSYTVHVAVLDASIDQSKTVGATKYLGDQIFRSPVQFPISYEVCYDPGEVEENVTYTVWISVAQKPSGMTLGLNEAVNPVITGGNPTKDVEIIVTPGFADAQ